jgi:hypothetical protein
MAKWLRSHAAADADALHTEFTTACTHVLLLLLLLLMLLLLC